MVPSAGKVLKSRQRICKRCKISPACKETGRTLVRRRARKQAGVRRGSRLLARNVRNHLKQNSRAALTKSLARRGFRQKILRQKYSSTRPIRIQAAYLT